MARANLMQLKATQSSGFTLIELVVAMVIVAIVSAIAIPAYSSYVRQSHRTDAKTALLDLASLEERYFSTTNTYSNTTTQLGYSGSWPVTVGSGYYQVAQPTINAATTTTVANYTLTATAIGNQVNDTQCLTFTLTSTGVQSATPDPTNTCWH
jgi:type IV pilus assembly protein PilE